MSKKAFVYALFSLLGIGILSVNFSAAHGWAHNMAPEEIAQR